MHKMLRMHSSMVMHSSGCAKKKKKNHALKQLLLCIMSVSFNNCSQLSFLHQVCVYQRAYGFCLIYVPSERPAGDVVLMEEAS